MAEQRSAPRRYGFDIRKLPDPDGLGSYCRELLRALVPQLAPEESLWLYGPKGLLPDVTVAQVVGSGEGTDRVVVRHDHDPANDSLALYHATAWHLPPHLDCPTLFTAYDLTVLSHPRCHTVDNRIHTLEGLLQAHLAGSHFLAISQATATEMTRWLGVSTARMSVIYPAVAELFTPLSDPSAGASVQRQLEERFGIEGAPVLAVGTVEPRKNLLRLLEAYAALPEALRVAHPLVLAGGEGWQDRETLSTALARPELASVHRLGAVAIEDLQTLYRGAAVFAYPSLAEGFGLPILEAMACGAPVLTSHGGATAEVAGEAALLVDALDTPSITQGLAELLGDSQRRQTLRAQGLGRARQFSWRTTAAEVLALYRRHTA